MIRIMRKQGLFGGIIEGRVMEAHIFGHVHEQSGSEEPYHNVSILDENYEVVNSPTVFEVREDE